MSNKLVRKIKKEPFKNIFDFFSQLMDNILCTYFLFIIVVLPIYNKGTYANIASGKISLTMAYFKIFLGMLLPCAMVMPGIYLLRHSFYLKREALKELLSRLSMTDIFVICYFAANVFSFLFSDYKKIAFWGTTGWGMGLFTQICFFISYFFISRFWKPRKWLLGLMIPVSFLLFVIGYLNRFGIYPVSMEANSNPQFISFIGNINWYCGYMVIPIFGSATLIWYPFADNRFKYLLHTYLLIAFGALITNGSNSGVMTLLVLFFFMLVISMSDAHHFKAYWELVFTFSLSCIFTLIIRILFPDAINYQDRTMNFFTYSMFPVLLAVFSFTMMWLTVRSIQEKRYPEAIMSKASKLIVGAAGVAVLLFIAMVIWNTLHPGSLGALSQIGIFTFSPEWGSRRGATWTAGIRVWLEQPAWKKLFGVGPECMRSYIYTDASADLYNYVTSVWPIEKEIYLSNAHCEPLNILAEKGLLGLVSFLGIIASTLKRSIELLKTPCHSHDFITLCCTTAILAYAVHNLASFQQICNTSTMFLLLGTVEAYHRRPQTF